jgi:hypothetical protein
LISMHHGASGARGWRLRGNYLLVKLVRRQEGDISKRYHTIFTRVRGSTGGSGKSYPDFFAWRGSHQASHQPANNRIERDPTRF